MDPFQGQPSVKANEIKHLDRIKSVFWRETMGQINQNKPPNTIKTEGLWNNNLVRYKGSPLFFSQMEKSWVNNQLLTFQEMQQIVGPYAGLQLDHNALIHAIPNSWKIAMTHTPATELIITTDIIH